MSWAWIFSSWRVDVHDLRRLMYGGGLVESRLMMFLLM